MKTHNRITILSILLLLSASIVLAAGGINERTLSTLLYGSDATALQNSTRSMDEISATMQKLELLYRLVDRDFLFDIDDQAVYESMAKALFTALGDPYSAYVVAKEASDFNTDTTGRYGGIGAYISKTFLEYRDFNDPKTYMVNISSVFPGSPAEQAGLRSGDLISHIDGKPVDDLEANEASAALKGLPDTPVVLTIQRGTLVFEVTVIRKIVSIPTTTSTIVDGTIGYLRIIQFTEPTGEQVRSIVQDFADKDIKALVLDLRDNPGGIVDSALGIADMFLSNVPIVQTNSKKEASDRIYRASRTTLLPNSVPIVVLVNSGSASSSEILAGALKDNGRAILVGSTTFGKGLIQLVSPFGDGYYTLTTSQYRTPNGNDIHEIGISADIEVDELQIPDELMENYTKLIESRIITDFVEENPGYSEEHMDLFFKTQDIDPMLSVELYRLLLRREYIYQMPYEDRPVVDPEYDPVLSRALEYLGTII